MKWPVPRADLPPALRFVATCLACAAGGPVAPVRRALPHVAEDWPAVLAAAGRHRVDVAVAVALRRADWTFVPAAIREALTRTERAASLRALSQTAETERLSQALEAAAIPFFTVKGPPLGLLLFDSATVRQSKDIDIVVDPDAVDAATAVLRALRYEPTDQEAHFTPRQRRAFRSIERHSTFRSLNRGAPVELHWQLNADNLFDFDVKAAWKLRTPVRIGNGAVPVLPPETLLLYLACHGAGHAWFRLKWLIDIAAILRRWDDAAIRAGWDMAVAEGLQSVLGSAFLLARDVLDAPVPPDIEAYAEADPAGRRLTAVACRAMVEDDMRRLSPHFWWSSFHLRPDWSYRTRHALRSLYAPNDWTRFPLPDALFPLYFLMRPFTWLGRGGLGEPVVRRAGNAEG
ncbi:hypothetical protein ABIE65_001055 [Constrictibacter sp. MBR-5]|jgi:hypothetical protein